VVRLFLNLVREHNVSHLYLVSIDTCKRVQELRKVVMALLRRQQRLLRTAKNGIYKEISIKKEVDDTHRQEPCSDSTTRKRKLVVKVEDDVNQIKKIKAEADFNVKEIGLVSVKNDSPLKSRKLKAYSSASGSSPFPNFPHPTPSEAKQAHSILAKLHGPRKRPTRVIANPDRAGCGDSPSVLDALVRTILSQNTSDVNSSRAKKSMDVAYGGSDNWDAIVYGGQAKLEEAIRCGGLSKTKSGVITSLLKQVKEKHGEYSLDHLFDKSKYSNEAAMQELISFQGVGPKTASCVLLFCLGRESFAVDTHVHRITGLLGWRPAKASRDETHAHLDVMIPDEDKYGLHVLLVTHGKKCPECRAGGRSTGSCDLRKSTVNLKERNSRQV
jgi:endonuclease III